MGNEEHSGKKLQSSKPYRSLASDDTCKITTQERSWRYENNSILKGWKPKTESNETDWGRVIVGSLQDSEDLMGDISIDDITKKFTEGSKCSRIWNNRREKQAG